MRLVSQQVSPSTASSDSDGLQQREDVAMTVTVATSLREIVNFETLSDQQARLERLRAGFQTIYPGHAAHYLIRAPGRVNLIGEHIDYAGHAVLPMAIDRDLMILMSKSPCATPGRPMVHVRSDGYTQPLDFEHDVSPPLNADADHTMRICSIDASVHSWGNYFKAGYKGIYSSMGDLPVPNFDLRCFIHSTVPAGSGLSSSSAMVVASALTTLVAADLERARATPLLNLISLAIESERLIGMNSGGMDQAISILGRRGAAAVVHFTPSLRADRVSLPPGSVFVVAHSLAAADKHKTAARHYNLRVVETRLAAAILATKVLNLPLQVAATAATGESITRPVLIADLARAIEGAAAGDPRAQLRALGDLIDEELTHSDGARDWTLTQVASTLKMSEDDVFQRYCAVFPVEYETLQLWARARHVVDEALRVLDADAALRSLTAGSIDECAGKHAPQTTRTAALRAFADLMNASHQSCRDLYECSHPDLEELVSLSRRAGALGARLTGAGWGGSTVHLLEHRAHLPAFLARLERDYYRPRNVSAEKLPFYLFATDPGAGAGVLALD